MPKRTPGPLSSNALRTGAAFNARIYLTHVPVAQLLSYATEGSAVLVAAGGGSMGGSNVAVTSPIEPNELPGKLAGFPVAIDNHGTWRIGDWPLHTREVGGSKPPAPTPRRPRHDGAFVVQATSRSAAGSTISKPVLPSDCPFGPLGVPTQRLREDCAVSWSVVLTGSRDDVRRLAEEFPNLVPVEGSEHELLLSLSGTDAAAAQAEANAFVERVNGFGRLQWGRTFLGLSVGVFKSIGPDGRETQSVVLGAARAHLSPEEFADFVERLGLPRPEPPRGLEYIRALRGGQVEALASVNSSVAHALKLVDQMLVGDEELDWAAAYSAMETIDENLRAQGVDGQVLGWWTGRERTRFNRTANSVHVLGWRSRHTKRKEEPPPRPMTSTEAVWFVRAAVARWMAWLIERHESATGPADSRPGAAEA